VRVEKEKKENTSLSVCIFVLRETAEKREWKSMCVHCTHSYILIFFSCVLVCVCERECTKKKKEMCHTNRLPLEALLQGSFCRKKKTRVYECALLVTRI